MKKQFVSLKTNFHKGMTFFICVSRPAHALISASGKKKKKFQRKCVRLDKFAWTSTVLNSRREIDRLLDTNNSIWRLMEKVNLLVQKLFLAVHRSSK